MRHEPLKGFEFRCVVVLSEPETEETGNAATDMQDDVKSLACAPVPTEPQHAGSRVFGRAAVAFDHEGLNLEGVAQEMPLLSNGNLAHGDGGIRYFRAVGMDDAVDVVGEAGEKASMSSVDQTLMRRRDNPEVVHQGHIKSSAKRPIYWTT